MHVIFELHTLKHRLPVETVRCHIKPIHMYVKEFVPWWSYCYHNAHSLSAFLYLVYIDLISPTYPQHSLLRWYWEVSSSTWGVARVSVCIQEEAERQIPDDYWRAVFPEPILYALTLRYNILVLISKCNQVHTNGLTHRGQQ